MSRFQGVVDGVRSERGGIAELEAGERDGLMVEGDGQHVGVCHLHEARIGKHILGGASKAWGEWSRL